MDKTQIVKELGLYKVFFLIYRERERDKKRERERERARGREDLVA